MPPCALSTLRKGWNSALILNVFLLAYTKSGDSSRVPPYPICPCAVLNDLLPYPAVTAIIAFQYLHPCMPLSSRRWRWRWRRSSNVFRLVDQCGCNAPLFRHDVLPLRFTGVAFPKHAAADGARSTDDARGHGRLWGRRPRQTAEGCIGGGDAGDIAQSGCGVVANGLRPVVENGRYRV